MDSKNKKIISAANVEIFMQFFRGRLRQLKTIYYLLLIYASLLA